ncbi:MAG TPA: NAD(P)/FAD-dependent oxidoreductase [Actinomycetes bacterium]|nr:NAD(P)/FAD-dependent oxidoreductase [Actinomycetes bacterium]
MSTLDGFDAVVVGSGPNGLVGAVTMAESGMRVLVLEAAEQWGGGLRTEELTLSGFRHDVCSSVHPLAQASPAFRGLALERDGLRWAHPAVPLAHPLDASPSDAILLRRSVEETAASLGVDGPKWRRWLEPLVARSQPMVDTILDPLHVPAPAAVPALSRFGLLGLRSASSLARSFKGERGRALLAGNSAHSILDLSQPVTGGFGLLLALLAHSHGWPVAVGGSQSIADALVTRLQSLGGSIELAAPVTTIDALTSCPRVLLDLTPRQFLDIAAHRLPSRYERALSNFRYGPGVFKVDWALDGPVPWLDERAGEAGTVHLGGSFAEIEAGERAVQNGRHPDRPFVLYVQASAADPTRAPAGKHTGWAYCHVPNGSTVDMTAAIEAQVERFAPGFRDRILARHTMGPKALEAHNANLVGGDIGGGVADIRQLVARPVLSTKPWRTPLPGVFIGSAATPPGGGVHGMGGWHAAQLALGVS